MQFWHHTQCELPGFVKHDLLGWGDGGWGVPYKQMSIVKKDILPHYYKGHWLPLRPQTLWP